MKPNASVLIAVGAVSLAAVAGVTSAIMQKSQSSVESSSTISPSVVVNPTPLPGTSQAPETPAPAGTGSSTPNSPDARPPARPTEQPKASRRVESCKIDMAIVKDPEPPLNVRSAPSTQAGQVVGTLQNGTFVSVEREQDGWFQISTPIKGWISSQRTDHGCSRKVERVEFAPGATTIEIADRFIGTGSHTYHLQANQGQTLTLTRQAGPFPMLLAPDGKPLADIMPDDNRSSWSGTLPVTGQYTVEYDSNFKGYQYAFQIEIR